MMKDFRYHVVSLTAVFVALAVGVVLGSGPMRTALVGDMADQIESLEQEVSAARAEVTAVRAQTGTAEQFADEAAPALLTGALQNVPVAVIQVEGAAADDVTGVRDRLVQSGAVITAELTIEDLWTDPGQVAFRSSLASTMAPNVTGIEDEASPATVLAHALAQALVPASDPADADDPEDPAARASLLRELLLEAELISGTVTGDVTAVVIVAGPGADDDQRRADDAGVMASLAAVLASHAAAVTVASGPEATGDIPSAVANSPAASATVATVVEGSGYFGRIAVPLVTSQALGGTVVQSGPGADRTLVPGAIGG